ncbi:MAG: radical SAM protein [Candidatus Muiribacteriota bacterium]|jgi:radical SAM protein with 4Fe4S-binding SPASM domain
MCYLETTRNCNLACPFCMTDSPKQTDELSTDEIKHGVIDELKKYSSKSTVAFSGGEFLLRKDAIDLLEYNSTIKKQWSFINTNGIILDKELIAEIKKATSGRCLFVFSLDSLNSIDDKLQHQNTIESLKEKTKMLDILEVPFFYVVTITKKNMKEIDSILKFATREGKPVLRSPFVPRGRGKDFDDLLFNSEDMKKYIHPALRENYLSYISFAPFFAAPNFFDKNWLKTKIAIKQLGCQAGRGYIAISAEGNVAPCVHLLDTSVVCGNIRNKSLYNILKEDKILKELRDPDKLQGKCGRCKYKYSCGGCRALAYYHNGHYLAEDPTCFFNPENISDTSEYEKLQNENVARFADFIIKTSPFKDFF